jgi:adenine-specific DNA methylase
MLFDTPSYFNHQFPAPQYLGAKHTHLAWINKFIPNRITTALDAFAGSQSMAFLFKQLGFKTITNDFLNFNHQIGLALIENNNIQLSNDDVNLLFSPAINKTDFKLIENLFSNVFFQQDEAQFLDNLRANIALLENPYKQALAYTIDRRLKTNLVGGLTATQQRQVYYKK